MKRRNYLFLFLVFAGRCFPGQAQNKPWTLKKDKDGIKVYSRNNTRSKFNELKVETDLSCRLSDLAAVILDIPDYPQWSFNVKSSKLLKQVSPAELYIYTEINSPWPADNRDLPIHLKITQDPTNKKMTIAVECIPDLVPRQKNIVRVPLSKETWVVTPVDASTIHIEYQLEVDPGADPPGWLINMFSVKGPFETFSKLKNQIKLPQYRLTVVPFITN
jgi:hypothetical protein